MDLSKEGEALVAVALRQEAKEIKRQQRHARK
jgi:hypothetical protein